MKSKELAITPGPLKKMRTSDRYYNQNEQLAVRDVYDALIELITNADDRYVFLEGKGKKVSGRIEIEVERKRKGTSNIVRVRDFADGMTSDTMEQKLCQLGERVSGMEEGVPVRGTNSRGGKDVAVLGKAEFESIAADNQYHKCEIIPPIRYTIYEPRGIPATENIRKNLRIPNGTGTVVTINIKPIHKTPQHQKLKERLSELVPLREILSSDKRTIVLRDLSTGREDNVKAPIIQGKDQLKVSFDVPGYPRAKAKLVIKRAKNRLQGRLCGILIKSRHAIHEATYFDPALEHDPHASLFFGKLTCEYIDELWNEYDDLFEKGTSHPSENPCHIVDPLRKAGLRREHPFTKALFGEALKRFRPIVDAERRQEEKKISKIENSETRKRLNALERAAAKFMEQHITDEDAILNPDSRKVESIFRRKGFSLNPPFAQILVGQSCHFWLNISQDKFPEISEGDLVEIACLTKEVSSSKSVAPLEPHPTQDRVLRAKWLVKGESSTKATGIQVRIGGVVADSVIEVLESERQKYEHIKELCFNKKKYSVVPGKTKSVMILAPYPEVVNEKVTVDFRCTNPAFKLKGDKILVPQPELGIALCKLRAMVEEPGKLGQLEVRVEGHEATAQILSATAAGSPIKIELFDGDFGNQRFSWDGNTLKIATKHPSIGRYLGENPHYEGQETKHFRAILAEIVSEAVCQRVMSKKEAEEPEEYKDADWDTYYADYTRLMTEFLPIAHELQIREP